MFCDFKVRKLQSGWGSAPDPACWGRRVPPRHLFPPAPKSWIRPNARGPPSYPCIRILPNARGNKTQIRGGPPPPPPPQYSDGKGGAPLVHFAPGRPTPSLRHWPACGPVIVNKNNCKMGRGGGGGVWGLGRGQSVHATNVIPVLENRIIIGMLRSSICTLSTLYNSLYV